MGRWSVLVWRGFREDNRWANVVYRKVRASSGDRPDSHRGSQVREDVSAEADKVEGWQYPK